MRGSAGVDNTPNRCPVRLRIVSSVEKLKFLELELHQNRERGYHLVMTKVRRPESSIGVAISRR
jgi:hypothetical protein